MVLITSNVNAQDIDWSNDAAESFSINPKAK